MIENEKQSKKIKERKKTRTQHVKNRKKKECTTVERLGKGGDCAGQPVVANFLKKIGSTTHVGGRRRTPFLLCRLRRPRLRPRRTNAPENLPSLPI